MKIPPPSTKAFIQLVQRHNAPAPLPPLLPLQSIRSIESSFTQFGNLHPNQHPIYPITGVQAPPLEHQDNEIIGLPQDYQPIIDKEPSSSLHRLVNNSVSDEEITPNHPSNTVWQCPVPNCKNEKPFKFKGTLSRHMKNKHNLILEDNRHKKRTELINCPLCNTQVHKGPAFISHKGSINCNAKRGIYKCTSCTSNNIFNSRDALIIHIRQDRNNSLRGRYRFRAPKKTNT